MQNIIYILIISAILTAVFAMFSLNNQDVTSSPSSAILVGIGEAKAQTQGEAQELARYNALKELAEQIYVQVDSKIYLKETLKKTDSGQSFEDIYIRIIETTAKAELYGVSYTTLETKNIEGGFFAKVKAEIKTNDAFQNFKAGLIVSIIRTLREFKLIFTAKQIIDKLYAEEIGNYSQNLPNVIGFVLERSLVERDYRKALEFIYLIKGKSTKTPEDILDVGNLFTDLEIIAADYPSEELLKTKSKVYDFAKTIKLTLRVQKYVWKNERVYVELLLPNISLYANKDVKFLVVCNNTSTDRNVVVLRNAKGHLTVDINQIDSKVSFYFGGYEVASWIPKVFDSYDTNRKDLISSCAIIWLLSNQNGGILKTSKQDQLIDDFSIWIEEVFWNIFKEWDLNIKVFNLSYIERTLGNVEKLNINDLINNLRKYKMTRYLLILTPDFNIGKLGNWSSLRLSVSLRIIDIMTNESFYDFLSKESLYLNAKGALENILSSNDFIIDFGNKLRKYIKFTS